MNISIQHRAPNERGPIVEMLINDEYAGYVLLQIASDGMWKFYAYGPKEERLGKHWSQGEAMVALVKHRVEPGKTPETPKPHLTLVH